MRSWIECPHCNQKIDTSNGVSIHQQVSIVLPRNLYNDERCSPESLGGMELGGSGFRSMWGDMKYDWNEVVAWCKRGFRKKDV
jgi:hypothetical protein